MGTFDIQKIASESSGCRVEGESCPRCDSKNVCEAAQNSRGKDRSCGDCGACWHTSTPEDYSMFPVKFCL